MSKPLGTFAPDSPAWHDARRWRIGGSEIAQVCGQSPWGTADDLLAAKLAGPDATRRPSKAQERGTALEPAVLAWVCAREGLDLDPLASAATYVHDDLDWALYNPDGIDRGGALIEIKTTADRCAEHDERTGDQGEPALLTRHASCFRSSSLDPQRLHPRVEALQLVCVVRERTARVARRRPRFVGLAEHHVGSHQPQPTVDVGAVGRKPRGEPLDHAAGRLDMLGRQFGG